MNKRLLVSVLLTVSFLIINATFVMADAQAEYNKGYDFFTKKDFKQAIACFDKAIKENSGFVKAYTFRGYSNFMLEKYKESLNDLNTAIQLDPENATALYYRGMANFFLGYSKKAAEDFDGVLRKQKENAYAYFMKATCNLRLGDYAGAIHNASDTISYAPKRGDAYVIRGIAYLLQNKYEFASKDFNVAMELNPKDNLFTVYKFIVDARAGKNNNAEIEGFFVKGKKNQWPHLGAGLLIDKVTPEDCLSGAQNAATNDKDKKINVQQANFILSQYFYMKKDTKQGDAYLAKCMADQGPLFLIQGVVKEGLEKMKGK